ncbi:TonB-dependent receptor plug domain-containing protein [Silanimonas sp.]|uniref:TonB-dependent receptor plug domain-containing protein n=1 Tax=Silanimonas sp. TaxID=1929290 RepID=UPI0037CC7B33
MNRPALLALAIASALSAGATHAQSNAAVSTEAADDTQTLDAIVVTGTRVAGRSRNDTAAPVDAIGVQQLERTGSPEINQALSVALPSFNFPRPGLTDGTDTVRPAQLRGLAPDQTLVLVNSKRRHSASLVNVNGSAGRGSAAVDLNTIPTAAVRTVEVLRDGASAQYGSDAIAGVINVLLREDDTGGGVTINYGRRESTYEVITGAPPAGATWSAPARISRDVSDGETTTVSAWKGLSLGGAGFLTIAAELKDQERTERGGYDFRQQYPRVGTAFDPRETTINRFNAWYGEPELEQKTLFANAGIDFENGTRLYGWASRQDRDARSAGFYRPAQDARNITSIYPDGFLPIIAPTVIDSSAAGGVKWNWGEWAMDSSIVWGRNEMDFTIENTLNRSIGPSSQRTFQAGGFDYTQATFNFGGTRSFALDAFASDLYLSAGLEAREETYRIFAGEPNSYINGGALLNGAPTASGAQVFPGFRPSNEVDESRNAVGLYVDLEANLTDQLLGSVAIRGEDYSDFGSNLSGKVAMRYDFSEAFALRGSLQNGFRAPSPQQQFFTATSTNFINGVPFEITTFPATSPVAAALGARPLEAEESVNVSFGAVFNFGEATLTIDAYRIDIDNRIVLSENLTQVSVRNFLTAQGFVGIGGGRFFINGVDTETQGVDVVFTVPFETATAGRFDVTLLANWNNTDVTRVPTTAPIAAIDPTIRLFDRVNVLTFEEGSPKDKYGANLSWSLDRFGATLRATRYGEVLAPGTTAANDFVLSPKVLVDLEGRVRLWEGLELAIGVENLADEYPDPLPASLNTTGNTPFSNFSPFGRSGRFLYGRINYSF